MAEETCYLKTIILQPEKLNIEAELGAGKEHQQTLFNEQDVLGYGGPY